MKEGGKAGRREGGKEEEIGLGMGDHGRIAVS
jgi:hypothetical protein